MQKVYQLLIVVMLIGLSASRPNGNVDSQVKPMLNYSFDKSSYFLYFMSQREK